MAQDDQIQRSLENLMGLLVFTRHPSGLSRDESLLTTLECQVQAGAFGPPEPKMHLMIPVYIAQHSPVLCAPFVARAVRLGCVSRVHALVHAVAGNTFEAQAVDIRRVWR